MSSRQVFPASATACVRVQCAQSVCAVRSARAMWTGCKVRAAAVVDISHTSISAALRFAKPFPKC
eukprot:6201392-Pleurochrysis_carterae.AAC.2